MNAELRFAAGDNEFIIIEVLRYENTETTDETDLNWLACKICMPILGSHFYASLSTDDFYQFKEEVDDLVNKRSTKACFCCIEEWCEIIVSEEKERFSVKGLLKPSFDSKPLELSFLIRQEDIFVIKTCLQNIICLYPKRGEGMYVK